MRTLCRCLAALLIAASSAASAQSWPSKPVRFIASQGPGIPNDPVGRVVKRAGIQAVD